MKRILSVFLSVLLLVSTLSVTAVHAAAPVMDGATLVTFGDSITALSTWPRSVATALNMHLVNAGIGGNTTAHGKARFDRDVAAHDPDFVIMCFATNDFHRMTALGAPKCDLTTYRTNLQYFVDRVKAIGAEPILMTPPFISPAASGGPSYYPEGDVNAALDVYVNAMREIAAANNVGLIDIHSVCDNYDVSTFLISDGVHLSDQGNAVYTDTITAFMKSRYTQDPSAPRVEQPKAPAAEPGAWTKDIVPYTEDGWLNIYPDTINVTEEASGAISFANTNDAWPEIHYSPKTENTITAPVIGTTLTLDADFEAGSNILLFFNGPNPTLCYANTYVSLSKILAAKVPGFQTSYDDIVGGQSVQVSIPLSDIVPASFIAADGTVNFSGVKVFAVGDAGKKVTIHEMSITTTGGAAGPAVPSACTDVTSLLPTASSQITANQGVADSTLRADGSLTLAPSADSDIAWPSVKVAVSRSVDLSDTPYLHLKTTTGGGWANGYLYITTPDGRQHMVQLSALLSGTANDFATEDVYVDLATALGTHRTVTLDYYTLSVYGTTKDSLTWNTLSTAREQLYAPGDVNGDGELTTNDARYIMLHALDSVKLEEPFATVADISGDGDITTTDARLVILAALQ